jgi:zinc transporter 1
MSTLTISFTIVELALGILTHSLALLADAFHMISDQISLIIGFAAIQMSKRQKSHAYSYGWQRAEIIGALINGVFLLSVCLFIFLEAIQRFIDIEEVKDPFWIVVVGGAGLFINLIGLVIFRGHAHAGHSHGHSHGHTHDNKKRSSDEHWQPQTSSAELELTELNRQASQSSNNIDISDTGSSSDKGHAQSHDHGHGHGHGHGALNLHGVFLHILGDALGSIGAMISGLGIWLLPWGQPKYYLDPICSVVIACIILSSCIPLIRRCTRILMQSVPDSVDLDAIEGDLLKVEGVLDVHDLHVWHLADTKLIGTVHLTCPADVDFLILASKLKKIMHTHGVHSTTFQPEFLDPIAPVTDQQCHLLCEVPGNCQESLCCAPVVSLLDTPEGADNTTHPMRRSRSKSTVAHLP